MKKKSKRIAKIYSEKTNFDRDGSYRAPKRVDLSSVSVPISIRIPGKQLRHVKEFARRQGIPYQTLIKKWLAERLRVEAEAFLSEREAAATVRSYTTASTFNTADSKTAPKAHAHAAVHP